MRSHTQCKVKCKHDLKKYKFVPLIIHGDGVEFVDQDSLESLQLGPLLGQGNSLDCLFLIATWPYSVTHKTKSSTARVENTTWVPVMRELKTRLINCLNGRNKYGEKLTPGGHRFIVWSIGGDNEHHVNFFGCKHWSMKEYCSKCDCNRTTKDGLVIGKKRKWTEHGAFHKPSTNPIMEVPGMCCHTIEDDTLHDLFVHGLCSHLMGSALHTMIYKEGPGKQKTAPAVRLSKIFVRIRDICKNSGLTCPVSNIGLSNIHTPDKAHQTFPYFKAKGHDTKVLLPVVAKVAHQSSDKSDTMNMKRDEALHALSDLCKLMDEAPIIPSDSQAEQLMELYEKFADAYEWLHTWAKNKKRNLFNKVYKFHCFYHLCRKFKFLNPKVTAAFRGEDYIGSISVMGHNCTMGKTRLEVATSLCQKYREHMHLRLTRGDFLDEHN